MKSDELGNLQPSSFLDRAGLRGFPWKSAITLYTISYGWLFFVFDWLGWDDVWFLSESYNNNVNEAGLPPWAYSFTFVFNQFGPGIFRFFTFFEFFVSGLCLFAVLRNLRSFLFLSKYEINLIVLLFLVLPFNTARVSVNLFAYSSAYCIFFIAWYLMAQFKSKTSFLISSVLFFFSFLHAMLIPFFLLPLLHLIQKSTELTKQKSFGVIFRKKLTLFGIVPVIYWVCRNLFWPDKIKNYQFHFLPFLTISFYLVVTLAIMLFVFRFRKKSQNRYFLILLIGVLAVVLGMFAAVATWVLRDYPFLKYPIVMLGRSAWFNRHLILQPLGVSLIVVSCIGLISRGNDRLKVITSRVVLATAVLFSFCFGLECVIDYQKQKKIIEEISISDISDIRGWTFIDETALLNARGRGFTDQDWSIFIFKGNSKLIDIKKEFMPNFIQTECPVNQKALESNALVTIDGPETHWQALKNWVSDGDMGFKVTIDDTPGACKPGMATTARVSGAIPILFYFTGAKG